MDDSSSVVNSATSRDRDSRGELRSAQRSTNVIARVLSLLVAPFVRFDLPPVAQRPADQPLVWAPNHRSMFDTVAGLVVLYRMGFCASLLVNSRYFDSRVGGGLLKRMGAIAVDVDNGALRAVGEASRRLGDGGSVVIMAEGRVVEAHERGALGIGELSRGVVVIARRAHAPVVVAAMVGTDLVWPIGRRFPRIAVGRRPTIRVRLGDPVSVEGRPREALEELTAKLSDLVLVTQAEADRA